MEIRVWKITFLMESGEWKEHERCQQKIVFFTKGCSIPCFFRIILGFTSVLKGDNSHHNIVKNTVFSSITLSILRVCEYI